MNNKDRVVMISPYEGVSDLARQVFSEQRKNVDVLTAFLDKGVSLARQMEEQNVGVIISRGATGALIKAAVTIPVVLVEITSFDIIQALHKAKQLGNKIAFFDYWHRRYKYDFDSIREILGLEQLHIYYYHSENELNSQIESALANDCEVVVASGICIINQALDKGIPGVMLDSSKEAIQEALERAEEVLAIRKKDSEITERLKTIINHSYGGIIAVDASGILTHYNPAAENALAIPRGEVVGRVMADLKDKKRLQKLYAHGEPVLGDVQQIKDRKYIVSRVPLHAGGENLGVIITFQEVSKILHLEAKIRQELYAKGLLTRFDFSDIIGSTAKLKQVIDSAKKFSQSEATVLVTGESGTGKELFVQSIHQNSLRSKGPFVAINCAAIPENLLETELFGYEEGAFTGAKKGGSPGLFEIAHKGTLFLDEILELPLSLQARLLRVLQEKAVRRVGGHAVIPVDVRIIATSNRDMHQVVREGKFREDLYFRLNVLNLNIPTLRERIEDVPVLIDYFMERQIKKGGEKRPHLSPTHYERLMRYPWPGNIRELESFIEKYFILATGEDNAYITMEELLMDLDPNIYHRSDAAECVTVPLGTIEEMNASIINMLAEKYPSNKEDLAKKLGISRTTLWKKLKERSISLG